MKKQISLLVLFSLFFSSVNAQVVGGRSSQTILDMGTQVLTALEAQDREIVRMEYDIIFTEKESFRALSEDWEYTIVAFADAGVKILNISLWYYSELDNTWNKVTETDSDTNYAIIDYQPTAPKSFRVIVKVDKFSEGYTIGRYGLFYMHY
jgi:hypothetical protein